MPSVLFLGFQIFFQKMLLRRAFACLLGLCFFVQCQDLAKQGAQGLLSGFSVQGNWKVQYQKEIFNFFEDGQFTHLVENNYREGTYSVRGNVVTLQPANGSPLTITIKERDPEFLRVIFSDSEQTKVLLLDGTPLDEATADPYHPSQNTWRKHPQQPESEAELRSRL
jgi:hypothetical protein